MKTKFILLLLLLLSSSIFFISCDKEISRSPAEPEPPQGFIYVESEPAGFKIYLDDRFTGRFTPDSIPFVEETIHDVTLKREYWRDTSFSVEAREGDLATLNVNYYANPAMYGSVNFLSDPTGAQIIFGDSLLEETTPFVLNHIIPGIYNVEYTYPSHRNNSIIATVESKKTTKISLALRDTTIWVDYNTFTTPLPTNKLTCLTIDSKDDIWIGTIDKGVVKFDGKNWEVYNTANSVLGSDRILSIHADREDNVWIGTESGGLSKLSNSGVMTLYNKSNSQLINNNVISIDGDESGSIWVGTFTGMIKITNDNFEIYNNNTVGLATGWVREIKPVAPDDIWIVVDTFLTQYDGQNNFYRFVRKKYDLPNSNPQSIDIDNNGNVWVSFSAQTIIHPDLRKEQILGGLAVYDGANWSSIIIGSLSTQLPHLYIDSENIKWISSNNGLLKFYDMNTSEAIRTTNSGILSNDIRQVAEDSKGTLWIATGDGLAKYKKNLEN